MPLALVSASEGRFKSVNAEMLDRLQQNQFSHDENNHREIARLTVQRRITHMTLHFAKYAGYLASNPEDQKIKQTLTDILIIGLSSANVLNLRLSDHIDTNIVNKECVCPDIAKILTIEAGAMAAACEKLDHLENYKFRETLEKSVVNILHAIFAVFAVKNLNIEDAVTLRLKTAKAKQFLWQESE